MFNTQMLDEYIIPLLVALVMGSLLGLEREMSHRPAGLRTQTLITLGTVLFVLAAKSMGIEAARIMANILTGIGFIGGGVILQHKGAARGLTTAALIWVNGSLGLVIGLREYGLAVLGVLMALIVLRALSYVEDLIKTKCQVRQYWVLAKKDSEEVMSMIHGAIEACHFQEEPLTFHKTSDGIEMRFSFCNPPRRHQELTKQLHKLSDVIGVKSE